MRRRNREQGGGGGGTAADAVPQKGSRRSSSPRGGKSTHDGTAAAAAAVQDPSSSLAADGDEYTVHVPAYQLGSTLSFDYLEVSRRFERLVIPEDFVSAQKHCWNGKNTQNDHCFPNPTTTTTGTIHSTGGDNQEGNNKKTITATATTTNEVLTDTVIATGLGLSRIFNLSQVLPVYNEISLSRVDKGPFAHYDPANSEVQPPRPLINMVPLLLQLPPSPPVSPTAEQQQLPSAPEDTVVVVVDAVESQSMVLPSATQPNLNPRDKTTTTTTKTSTAPASKKSMKTVYNAKVVLLSGLSEADRVAALQGPGGEKSGGDHVSRLLKFIVARAGTFVS